MIQKEVIREILLENRKEIELQHIVPRDIQMEEFAQLCLDRRKTSRQIILALSANSTISETRHQLELYALSQF